MKFLVALAALIVATTAQAKTPVYKNTCPAVSKTDPTYLAGLASLKSAVQAGGVLHVSMELPEGGKMSYFYSAVTAAKITDDFASALIPMRPAIDNNAAAIQTNGLVVGSFDSLGNYVYGQYLFGSNNTSATNSPANMTTTYPCYVISWFVD